MVTAVPPNWTEIASVVISALTFLTIAVAAVQLIFHSRQMHRDFESLYVQRYWALMDHRSPSFTLERIPTQADRPVLRGYLQLSEDEIDLRSQGRVTDHTWKFWSSAILEQCASVGYADELDSTSPSEYPRLRRLISTDGAWDPLEKNRLWRLRHGL